MSVDISQIIIQVQASESDLFVWMESQNDSEIEISKISDQLLFAQLGIVQKSSKVKDFYNGMA